MAGRLFRIFACVVMSKTRKMARFFLTNEVNPRRRDRRGRFSYGYKVRKKKPDKKASFFVQYSLDYSVVCRESEISGGIWLLM